MYKIFTAYLLPPVVLTGLVLLLVFGIMLSFGLVQGPWLLGVATVVATIAALPATGRFVLLLTGMNSSKH